ncbi:MAG: exodeoxyribonuclease VII small subunit [Candidatus Aureabacteria bacterium]|nr:exodeoxyribonuclease VII small subunit [Candidatus Auribacterota bacterium]
MAKEKKPKFEAALKRLEEIVALMEDEKIPLDEALERYEEGIGLAKSCAQTLDAAEKRIEMLTKGDDGRVKAVPFAPGDARNADAGTRATPRRSPGPPAEPEPGHVDPAEEQFLF